MVPFVITECKKIVKFINIVLHDVGGPFVSYLRNSYLLNYVKKLLNFMFMNLFSCSFFLSFKVWLFIFNFFFNLREREERLGGSVG